MPTKILMPFPPLVTVELDGPITWSWLEPQIQCRLGEGVSLCITSSEGEANRGGYFFHFRHGTEGFTFSTFDREDVLTFVTGEESVEFMNHVSGRKYDENMWSKCQSVNLRSDKES